MEPSSPIGKPFGIEPGHTGAMTNLVTILRNRAIRTGSSPHSMRRSEPGRTTLVA